MVVNNYQKKEKIFWIIICCPYICTPNNDKGSLAQLVQSICLTSRGSLVRIQ